jgi:hypothetical protein
MYLLKNIPTIFYSVIAGSLVVIFLVFSSVCFAEPSIPSYCELSLQSLQQQVSNFKVLITLANQYSNDPTGFATAETVKQETFEKSTNYLMESFGVTPQEYVLYMGKHKVAVESYWSENPDLRQQLDELSSELMALLIEFEKLKGNLLAEAPPL